jgi:phosphate-selective porin OprO and OprP
MIATGVLIAMTMLVGVPIFAQSQQTPANNQQTNGSQVQSSLDNTLAAGDEEFETPAHDLVKWNHHEWKYFSIRFGAGFLYDYAAYSQDAPSKQQFQLFATPKVRDSRFILKGAIKGFKRDVTWSAGILYDPPTKKFLVRETGVMIAVPEALGYVFVGRTKEGFSLNKVMVGYAGWTMERAPISDATIPILADGIKFLGWAPKQHLLWNVGIYKDWLSEGQSFSTYEHQAVGRFAWVPLVNEETVLHLGTSLRHGVVEDGMLQVRSRPEVFEAPYFVDTGKFPAKSTNTYEIEEYYRPGSFLFGSEYFWQQVNSPEKGNPSFNGGDVVFTWLITGEIRPYNTRGGFFEMISPKRPVFQGGPGAWELVTRFSYTNLNSGQVQGGKFWRFTPMGNWYLSDNIRLEFQYGYGSLNRFDLVGKTQFFQTRIQLTF